MDTLESVVWQRSRRDGHHPHNTHPKWRLWRLTPHNLLGDQVVAMFVIKYIAWWFGNFDCRASLRTTVIASARAHSNTHKHTQTHWLTQKDSYTHTLFLFHTRKCTLPHTLTVRKRKVKGGRENANAGKAQLQVLDLSPSHQSFCFVLSALCTRRSWNCAHALVSWSLFLSSFLVPFCQPLDYQELSRFV